MPLDDIPEIPPYPIKHCIVLHPFLEVFRSAHDHNHEVENFGTISPANPIPGDREPQPLSYAVDLFSIQDTHRSAFPECRPIPTRHEVALSSFTDVSRPIPDMDADSQLMSIPLGHQDPAARTSTIGTFSDAHEGLNHGESGLEGTALIHSSAGHTTVDRAENTLEHIPLITGGTSVTKGEASIFQTHTHPTTGAEGQKAEQYDSPKRPDSLPSRVETLPVCPRFRILVVGNAGVGKSSLVSNVFNFRVGPDIDIAHSRTGRADIAREYTSDTNARFILHDSQGFEPGSIEEWEVVEKFIRDKCDKRLESKDRLHAIWLCIETPRTGARLMQTADERLLALATDLKVAMVIVFTKYDILFREYHQKAIQAARSRGKPADADTIRIDAETNARHHLDALINGFQKRFEYVTVSTDQRYPKRFDMFRRLAETTRRCLHEVEGDLWIPWAAAQQIHAQQKVDFSINEGFKKYWIDVRKSGVFKGLILLDCLSRIHLDLIEVWNFYDPEKLLSGTYFCKEMVRLIEPLLLTEPQPGLNMSETPSNFSDLTIVKFLCRNYQAIPLTALCIGAYMVDITLVLHGLFMSTLVLEPPRPPLNMELVADALQSYKDSDSGNIHRLISEIVSGMENLDPREKIAGMIRQQLKMDVY